MDDISWGRFRLGGDIDGDGFCYIQEKFLNDPPVAFTAIKRSDQLTLRFEEMPRKQRNKYQQALQDHGISYALYYEDGDQDTFGQYYDGEADEVQWVHNVADLNKNLVQAGDVREAVMNINPDEYKNSEDILEAIEDEMDQELVATYNPEPLTVQGYDYRTVLDDKSLRASITV